METEKITQNEYYIKGSLDSYYKVINIIDTLDPKGENVNLLCLKLKLQPSIILLTEKLNIVEDSKHIKEKNILAKLNESNK